MRSHFLKKSAGARPGGKPIFARSLAEADAMIEAARTPVSSRGRKDGTIQPRSPARARADDHPIRDSSSVHRLGHISGRSLDIDVVSTLMITIWTSSLRSSDSTSSRSRRWACR